MSLDTQKFIDMMREDHYRDGKWEIFNDALIAADAIIAGGAVLAAYNQDSMYINDVDIYIHASKTLKFVDDLDKSILNYRISYGNYIAPAYDQSFLRDFIYPHIKYNSLIHASFHRCENHSKPFPI